MGELLNGLKRSCYCCDVNEEMVGLAGYRARNQPGRFPDQTFPER